MNARRVLLSAAVGLVSIAATLAQTTQTDETIKVETRLVSVPTVVSDHNGRYIPGLKKGDFKVFQDGVEQSVEFFAATEEPINVALLIDTSQSTRPVIDDIKDSAKSFLKLLKPQDKAMVVTFDYGTHILSPLTSDIKQIKQAIDDAEIPPRGQTGTMMRDAVLQTVNGAFRDLTGRKAIILLTDGKDVGSRITPPQLLYRMQETDTLVYSVMFQTGMGGVSPQVAARIERTLGRRGIFGGMGLPPPQQQGNGRQGPNGGMGRNNGRAQEFLEELSEVSAGRFYSSKDGKLKETFGSIVEELRFQYRLGYYPPEDKVGSDPMVHEIKVRVSRQDSVVRARSTYRAQR